ncbi:hypothetical protein WDU94_012341 [Cyamophila willieti]
MGNQIIIYKPTGGHPWKSSQPGTHKGGICVLTFESVTGIETTFLLKKMNTNMDTTMNMIDETVEVNAGAAETSIAASAPMQVEEAGGVQEVKTVDPTAAADLQRAASNLNRLHLDKPKLSGAQRRKLQAQRALERGDPIPPRKKSSKPCGESGGSSLTPVSGVAGTPRKRQRSQVSTPSTGKKVQKKRKQNPGCKAAAGSSGAVGQHATSSGVTYSQALTGFKMAIVPKDYPEQKLVESCSTMVKAYLFKEILKTPKGTPAPSFLKNSFEKGALVMVCRDEFTRTWLENKVQEVPEVLGIHVKVGNYRDIIIEHKAIFLVSKETRNFLGNDDPKEVLSLMGIQNSNLDADSIGIVSVQTDDTKGSTFVVSLGDDCLKVIRESGYKLSLGLETITVRVPGDRRANANAEGDSN